jgi:hypothetical protein
MTEAEWHDDRTNPQFMLDWVESSVSERKLRLFAVACCRGVWQVLGEASRFAVEATERYVDGKAEQAELERARRAVIVPELGTPAYAPTVAVRYTCAIEGYPACVHAAAASAATAGMLAACGSPTAPAPARTASRSAHLALQASVLRDIVRNPFEVPTAFAATWRTPAVLARAQRAYGERSFDRLPELATALEEAGCDDASLLTHLRGSGPHVRGCWALDLVLDKS